MRIVLPSLFVLALMFVSLRSVTNNNGPGGGYSNAPNESNCTSCHTGASLNSGGFASTIKLADNFTGGGYIPDSSYTLKLQMSQSGIRKWGFNITALNASDDKPAGDFTITSSKTQRRTKSVSGSTRSYVEHTSGGTSSTNSVEWEFTWKAPTSNVGDVKFYSVLNAANGNGGNSGDTIYAKVFTVEPSSLLPEAQPSTKDTLICSGSTANFVGAGTNSPTTYSWLFPNGSPSISSDKNPKITYNFPGTQRAMLRVKNAKGWSGYDTIQVKVLQSPTAFISGGNARKMCKGGSIDLTAQFRAGSTYKWSNGATGNTLTVTDTGEYQVIVKSGICEKASNIVRVDFYNDVRETLTSSHKNDSICEGEIVNFSTASTYDSFFWYRNDQLLAASDTHIYNVPIDSSGDYTVKVKDKNGCISLSSDTISYTAIPKEDAPVVSCKNQTPFSVEFDWKGLQSHGGAEVSINKGASWITPSSGSTGNLHKLDGLTPEEDYEVWVRGTLPQPCFYTNITKKVCRSGKCSPLEATIKADSMVCDGDQLTVEVNGLANEIFSMTFEGGQPFTDTIFNFTPLVDKSYSIEILDSAYPGCPPKKLSFPVHLDQIELLEFRTQRPNNTFCEGDTIQFSATSGNDSYEFYVNNSLRATTTDSFYFESQFGDKDSAYVLVKKGACSATSETIFVSVVPSPSASFTYTNVGSQYAFTPDEVNYQSYFWDFGDGFTSVLKEPDHNYKTSSGKTVTVKLDIVDNNNCSSTESDDIKLPDFSSVHLLADGLVKIYPSPMSDVLSIEWIGTEGIEGELIIRDAKGIIVHHSAVTEVISRRNISDLAPGTYSIEIRTEEGFIVKRMLKL